MNPEPPRKARFIVRIRRIAAILGVGYLLICMGCYSLQDRMIFPGKDTQGLAEMRVAETPTTKLIRLNLADGTPIVARFDLATGIEPEKAPTILLFYGNGQCAQTTSGVIYIFQQLGCNVLTPDYPGYGMSGGKPSETALYESANVCWKYLQSRTDLDQSQLHIVGWSLGTGVAIDLASRVTPKTLTTISAYTSMVDMARRVAPFLPVSLILKHHFRSIDKIADVKCPILMIHGARDTIIPVEMTPKLASRAKSATKTVILPNSGHNDIFDADIGQMVTELRRHIQQ